VSDRGSGFRQRAVRRPFPGAPAVRPGAFELNGPWTISALLRASAEVWMDLADIEDDEGIAVGYRAMARDLDLYATALQNAAKRHPGPDTTC